MENLHRTNRRVKSQKQLKKTGNKPIWVQFRTSNNEAGRNGLRVRTKLQKSGKGEIQRNKARRSIQEEKRRKGVLLEQSNHTITFLPAGRKQRRIISKRGIRKTEEKASKPCCSREAEKQDWRYANEMATPSEQSDSIDQPIEFESSTTSTIENPLKQTTPPKQQMKTPAIKELKKMKKAKERRRTRRIYKTTNNLRPRIRQRRRTEHTSITKTKQNFKK